jgi:hypothetical protein
MIATTNVFPPYYLFEQAGEAYGQEARRVKDELEKVENGFEISVFYTGNAQTAIAELNALAARANEDDWDSEGGSKISPTSRCLAVKLLKKMPREWPAPEIDLDSDGDVSLQWHAGPGRRLTVSVGTSGKLSYAWMILNERGGLERNYGVAETEGVFPTTISDVVSKFGA